MPYRFFTDSTVETNVQRIFNEQIGKAAQELSEGMGDDPEKAIHNTRKRLKKGRSLLRLVRRSIGEKTYQRENDQLRSIGQALAPARDGAVYQKTLGDLIKIYGISLENKGLSELQDSLANLYQSKLKALRERDNAIAPILADLEASKDRLSQLTLHQTGWKAISKSLEQIYRQGQDRFHAAYKDGDDEVFHDWRKRVKDLWYNSCLLKQAWPPVMETFGSETHYLSELLGDGHDIAVLQHFLQHPPSEVALSDTHLTVLMPLLAHRQEKLHRQAKDLGEKLYSEKPKTFIRRIHSYWQSEFSSSGEP
ncbi:MULTISPECIES: CHAD domain-containing protein [Cyanophyceae]|uniref:CHAD domain-containing protein n=1 Tax=Cyanophyceae TaxID=3028117 RepID=UPI001683FAE5|nr:MULTISPECIES: CHAD domain-containing protein [Cyanophyceae]MBD1915060.1 CHAD domain-containing protein [Phormidium sp. FACHB-77]MBD2030806.1 CHAD domain-containing protein [Phormidium sp. FACHB-322]MBD2053160.1 CHAD domain-containing protein [Leptolyngbya sp. FACHB-60]